ncbi:redoxin family protein [Allorhodopirellula solitaria]|nr:redoxin family protein [Allorhodopirellula solitaria]
MPLLATCSFLLATVAAVPVMAQSDAANRSKGSGTKLAEGQTAKDFTLPAVAGELSGDVKFSEVNEKGPVVVVVLRGYPGYQCPACSAQVADLVKHADQFAEKGVRVLLVYPGDESQLAKHADEFLHGTKLPRPMTFLLDPGYQFTNAYGLRWDAPRETAYPSTIVVDRSGKISFMNVSNSHRGRVKADDVLAAL